MIGAGPIRVLRERLRGERGVSIVEVVVAAMLLALGAVAIFKIVDAATRTSYRAEQSQVTSNLLQRELERMKSVPTADLWVVANGSETCDLSAAEPLAQLTQTAQAEGLNPVASGAGAGFAACEEVAAGEGDVAATVYRAVYWFDPDKPDCEPPGEEVASNSCGMKRIMLMVQPKQTASGGERTARVIQADVIYIPEEPVG